MIPDKQLTYKTCVSMPAAVPGFKTIPLDVLISSILVVFHENRYFVSPYKNIYIYVKANN